MAAATPIVTASSSQLATAFSGPPGLLPPPSASREHGDVGAVRGDADHRAKLRSGPSECKDYGTPDFAENCVAVFLSTPHPSRLRPALAQAVGEPRRDGRGERHDREAQVGALRFQDDVAFPSRPCLRITLRTATTPVGSVKIVAVPRGLPQPPRRNPELCDGVPEPVAETEPVPGVGRRVSEGSQDRSPRPSSTSSCSMSALATGLVLQGELRP